MKKCGVALFDQEVVDQADVADSHGEQGEAFAAKSRRGFESSGIDEFYVFGLSERFRS